MPEGGAKQAKGLASETPTCLVLRSLCNLWLKILVEWVD